MFVVAWLPPALVEEVIFSVVSICLCVCLSVCLHSAGSTVRPTDLKFSIHIKDHHFLDESEDQGHRSKVKVTKVKISVFSLVSEKVVQVEGQGCKVNVKVARVNVKGHRSRS